MTLIARKVTQNSFYILAGRIAALGFNMITIVVLARYWGKETFGVFSYALVFVGFFALLPDFGMQPVLVREISKNRSRLDAVWSNALTIKVVFALIAFIAANLYAGLAFDDPLLRSAILILSLTLFVTTKSSTVRVAFESVFYADMQIKYPVLFQLIDGVVQTAIVLLLVWLRADTVWILACYVLANLPGLLATLVVFFRHNRISFSPDRKVLQWLMRESFPLALYLAMMLVYDRLDVLFLQHFWGEEAVGLYSAAFRLTAPMAFIPFAITTTIYPLLARGNQAGSPDLDQLFGLGLKILLLIGISIGMVSTLFAPLLINLLYGADFAASGRPFEILIWSQSVFFLAFFLIDYNNSQQRQRRNTLYILLMLVIGFVVQHGLISRFMIHGAAWAKLLLNTLGVFLLAALTWKSLSGRQHRAFMKIVLFLLAFIGIEMIHLLGWIGPLAALVGFLALALAINRMLFDPVEKQQIGQAFRAVLSRRQRERKESISSDG
ncbi:MAG TPA: flippase [bacterium]|nr:flippase [bacterium]HPG45013.1 flippase [bacterium]HPM97255.1 flippase [bacterium]